MVYLLNIVIFHGYVSHNQRVPPKTYGCASFSPWTWFLGRFFEVSLHRRESWCHVVLISEGTEGTIFHAFRWLQRWFLHHTASNCVAGGQGVVSNLGSPNSSESIKIFHGSSINDFPHLAALSTVGLSHKPRNSSGGRVLHLPQQGACGPGQTSVGCVFHHDTMSRWLEKPELWHLNYWTLKNTHAFSSISSMSSMSSISSISIFPVLLYCI